MREVRIGRISLGTTWSPVVKTLILINTFVFVSILLVGNQVNPSLNISYRNLIMTMFAVDPQNIIHHYTYWQLITYQFIHEAFYHYLFNMLGLWWFGTDVERTIGSKTFVKYYLFCGVGAGLVSLLMGMSTIGASGAIYGLLLAYGLLFPNRVLYLYFVIPIKAKYCVVLFGLIELIALIGTSSNINHYAHLGGIFFGMMWFLYWSKKDILLAKFRDMQKKRKRKKFRLISNEPETSYQSPYGNDNENKTIH